MKLTGGMRHRRLEGSIYILLAVALVLLQAVAVAAWTDDPFNNTPICTAPGDQIEPQLVSDGFGGAIITWYDSRNGSNSVYAQRVNAVGVAQWTSNGIIICADTGGPTSPQIISDGLGGAIVTWQDNRSGNYDIYAQRINASGVAQWTANGSVVCNASGDQMSPQLISIGLGGAIVTWQDGRGADSDIYAQRVNAGGVAQWADNGVSVCNASGDQMSPQLISIGLGEAIVTWQDNRSGNYDIYAQRTDSGGAALWAANGVAICTETGDQQSPRIISDGLGGAIITWHDNRSGNDDIYARKVDSGGSVQWTANGSAVCNAPMDQLAPRLISDELGGAIITWYDNRSSSINYNIYAQRMNASGVAQWTANGTVVCSASKEQLGPQLISDGARGAIITWYDNRSSSSTILFDIYAQRLNANGVAQWTTGGIVVCNASRGQLGPQLISDGLGGAIITWYDNRSSNYNIYAQLVTSAGSLGSPTPTPTPTATATPTPTATPTSTAVACPAPGAPSSPSPANVSTGISIDADLAWGGSSNATYYDVYFGTNASALTRNGSPNASSLSLTRLSANTTYYWKVVATNACGSINGTVWNFTTGCLAPAKPQTPSPVNNNANSSTSVFLAWTASANASSYDVYFGTSATPSYYANTVNSSYQLPQLNYSTKYYWKAVARNTCGNNSSDTWNFTTMNAPVPVPTVILNVGGTNASWNINGSGVIQQAVSLSSADRKITLNISAGTTALGHYGEPLDRIDMITSNVYPSPDVDRHVVAAFDFGPDGATFNPGIQITLAYAPGDIPAGVNESSLVIACYNEITDKWQYIQGVVNAGANTVTFTVDHFTIFTIQALLPTQAGSGLATWAIILMITFTAILLGVVGGYYVKYKRMYSLLYYEDDDDEYYDTHGQYIGPKRESADGGSGRQPRPHLEDDWRDF